MQPIHGIRHLNGCPDAFSCETSCGLIAVPLLNATLQNEGGRVAVPDAAEELYE